MKKLVIAFLVGVLVLTIAPAASAHYPDSPSRCTPDRPRNHFDQVDVLVSGIGNSVCAAVAGADGVRSKQIVFSSNRAGTFDLWAMNRDGSDARRLTDLDPSDELQPDISPNGKRIVFVRSTGNTCCGPGGMDIYVMNTDGSGMRKLAATVEEDEYRPEWSPDGRRVLFSRGVAGLPLTKADLYTVDANGKNVRQITHSASGGASNFGSWSADGRRIAMFSSRGGKTGVWVMRADGSAARFLSAGSGPKWGRAADRIVFHRFAGGDAKEIFTIRPDGTGLRRLTNDGFDDRLANFAPDGKSIVFGRVTEAPCPEGYIFCPAQLWTMRPDGSGQKRLTEAPSHDAYPSFAR